jgi:hypothetical protein
MDAAEYKHVVLGLIFLKYISDAFEEQHAKLDALLEILGSLDPRLVRGTGARQLPSPNLSSIKPRLPGPRSRPAALRTSDQPKLEPAIGRGARPRSPPDHHARGDEQEQATKTVLEQAEVLSEGWVAAA